MSRMYQADAEKKIPAPSLPRRATPPAESREIPEEDTATSAYHGARLNSRALSPAAVLELQRTIGNAAVTRLLRQQALQRSAPPLPPASADLGDATQGHEGGPVEMEGQLRPPAPVRPAGPVATAVQRQVDPQDDSGPATPAATGIEDEVVQRPEGPLGQTGAAPAEGGPSGEDAPDALSPQEAETFEAVMNELSDEELEAALAEEIGEDATDETDAEASQGATGEATQETPAPAAGLPVQAKQEPTATVVQRVKQNKVTSIASATAPDLTLANILEANTSQRPRLVTLTRWRRIQKKHANRGRRKYVGIRHQNLQDNAGVEDLVLLLKLRRRAKVGKRRDKHYAGIEKKAAKKSQTAQNRTELLGEAVAAIRMEGYAGADCKLLIGYASGAGIDQLWVSPSKQTYYVVEAKGPGAKLKKDVFAVRGAVKGSALVQMSPQWIADRIPRLRTSNGAVLKRLLNDCALKVNNKGLLVNDNTKVATHALAGLIITAGWDTTTGETKSSLSNKGTYTF